MRKIHLFSLLVATALLMSIASCKKEDDDTNNNNNNNNPNSPLNEQFGGGAQLPSDADGALYAVNNIVVAEDVYGYVDTTSIGSAFAWFESATNTTEAGTVTCNDTELDIDDPFSNANLPWYYTLSDYIFDFGYVPDVTWNVSGGNGVTAFNYVDQNPAPEINWFNLASTININNPLTVNFTNVNSNDAVFFTVAGDKGRVNKAGAANATSVTFTAAELQQVAIAGGGQIAVQVMPVRISNRTFNGKKYYFVKQTAFAKGAFTQ